MVKKNAKSRVRKIDVSDAVEKQAQRAETKKAEEKLARGELFVLDTKGNATNSHLPKQLRQKAKLEKQQKGLSKLSRYEIAKIEKTRLREEAKAAVKAKGECAPGQKKKGSGDLFDLWGPAPAGSSITTEAKPHDHAASTTSTPPAADATSRSASTFTIKAATAADRGRRTAEQQQRDAHDQEQKDFANTRFKQLNESGVRRPKQRPAVTGRNKTSAAPAVVVHNLDGLSMNPGQSSFEQAVDEIVAEEWMQLQEEQTVTLLAHKPMTARLLDFYTAEELAAMEEAEKLREYKRLIAEDVQRNAGGGVVPTCSAPAVDSSAGGGVVPAGAGGEVQRKKTRTERNKIARVKKMEKELSAAKRQKLLEKSIGQVPNLLREMGKEEKLRAEKAEYVQQMKEEATALEKKGVVTKPKRIGRHKFVEQKVVPEKATSSLRATQVASAVVERVQSFQRRNMGELPPESNRAALLRVRKAGKRKQKANKYVQRSLLLS